MLDVPGLEVTAEKEAVTQKVARLKKGQFGPEEKVTGLFQSAPCMLAGISAEPTGHVHLGKSRG